jgi:hypothetical protein
MKTQHKYKLHLATSAETGRVECFKYIFIEGNSAIATEGHYLAKVPIKREDNEPQADLLISSDVWKTAVTSAKKHEDPEITITNNHVSATDRKGSTVMGPIANDLVYPEYRRVIPDFDNAKETVTFGINAKHLKNLADALDSELLTLTVIIDRSAETELVTKPIKVEPNKYDDTGNEATGIIMPNRTRR